MVADASGSFNVSHILEVSDTLWVHPDSLVIGARRYRDKGPLRGRLNDTLFRYVFAFASGAKLRDPRSGCALFPSDGSRSCWTARARERNTMCRYCWAASKTMSRFWRCRWKRPGRTVRRTAVAAAVHPRIFRPLSIHGVAVLSFLVDYFLFRLFYRVLSGVDFSAFVGISAVRICNVIARMLSSTLNFTLNRQLVFKDKGNLLASALKYYAVVVLILLVNTCLLMFLNEFCGIPAQIAKLITEAVLFTASLLLQRIFVFRGRSR